MPFKQPSFYTVVHRWIKVKSMQNLKKKFNKNGALIGLKIEQLGLVH